MTKNQRFAMIEHAIPAMLENHGFLPGDAEHLDAFAKPDIKHGDMHAEAICLNCQKRMDFRWGLTHGEGTCNCGWPARAYHYMKRDNGQEVRIVAILQYHPELVNYPGKPNCIGNGKKEEAPQGA